MGEEGLKGVTLEKKSWLRIMPTKEIPRREETFRIRFLLKRRTNENFPESSASYVNGKRNI